MSLKYLTLIGVGVLAACAESPIVEPSSGAPSAVRAAGAASEQAAAPSRPLRGTCTFASTFLPPEPGQPPNVRLLRIEEVCHISHLGLTTGVAFETSTFTPTGPVISNTVVYTAANGDQLFTSFTGAGTLPDQTGVLRFSGTEIVTGGTGRFAGASGAISVVGTVTPATRTGASELSGSLRY